MCGVLGLLVLGLMPQCGVVLVCVVLPSASSCPSSCCGASAAAALQPAHSGVTCQVHCCWSFETLLPHYGTAGLKLYCCTTAVDTGSQLTVTDWQAFPGKGSSRQLTKPAQVSSSIEV